MNHEPVDILMKERTLTCLQDSSLSSAMEPALVQRPRYLDISYQYLLFQMDSIRQLNQELETNISAAFPETFAEYRASAPQ